MNIEAILLLEEIKERKVIPAQQEQEGTSHSAASLAYAIASELHQQVKAQLDAAPAVGNHPPVLKADGDDFPFPAVPGSGAPSSSVPGDDDRSAVASETPLDKISDFILYIQNHPNDPRAVQNLLNYIKQLSEKGELTPDITQTLDSADIFNVILFTITQSMETSFFLGYNGVNGEAGASQFLQDFLASLNGVPSNKYTDAMKTAIQGQIANLGEFTKEHTDAQGHLIWVIGGITYDWSNPADQDVIQQLIFNQGVGGVPNPYFDRLNIQKFLAEYRVRSLMQLLEKFKKNPEIAIILWLVTNYDRQFQSEESGLAGTTQLLTNITNKYATPLLELAQSIGPDFSADQASQFARLFCDGSNIISIETQTKSIAGSWNTNVFSAIGNIQTHYTDASGNVVTGNLGTFITQFRNGQISSDDLAQAFRSLTPPAPSAGGGSSTSPGYQALLTALQSGGSLVTGTSKTVTTQLTTVSDTDNELIKLGQSLGDVKGGGFAQLIQTIINAFKSN